MTRLFRLCLFLLLPLAVVPARAADNPAGFITILGEETLQVLNQKSLAPQQREQKFREIFNQAFDLRRISTFVLGPYWRRATETQRQQFLKLFEDYIVQAYSARFGEYSGETFKITGERPEGADATLVTSQILRPGNAPPVHVDWRVAKTDKGFKITDVVVENVSMAITQRQEFASVIQRNGGQLQALLDLLRQKTSRG